MAAGQLGAKDVDGNVTCGDTLLADTSNSLVHATSRLVGVLGVQRLVIVETADAVLVTDSSRSHAVGKLVANLQGQGRTEHLLHRKTQRPWGWYHNIDEGHGFKVKRILVNPRAKLSLRRHRHRAEHWVVVKGLAEVTCDDKVFQMRENESTFIALGATHRLANPGDSPLEIIEVQSGSYLGEDDIEQLDDAYGRTGTALP